MKIQLAAAGMGVCILAIIAVVEICMRRRNSR